MVKYLKDLSDELSFLFLNKKARIPCDDKWLSVVYYREDIFQVVNTFNWSLWGKGVLTKQLNGWVC